MPNRAHLAILLVLMVALPVGGAAVLGVRLVRDGEALVARQADDLAAAELGTVATLVAGRLAEREQRWLAALATLPEGADAEAIRAWQQENPTVGPLLVVDRDGRRLFPPLRGPTSESERRFVERTRSVWEDEVLNLRAAGAGAAEGSAPTHGWHGWFHDGGLRLLLWRAVGARGDRNGRIVAAELSRARLLADLVEALPETALVETGSEGAGPEGASTPGERTVLLDAGGQVAYAWGGYAPPEEGDGAAPRVTAPLLPPLSSWRAARWTPPATIAGEVTRGLRLGVALGVAALALALAVVAVWLYRERTREMRLGMQRVSFVGQVSHELRTPLTNIRLYAELLADGFDPDDDLDRERLRQLGVVVEETRRLERLIGNVLSFARGQQGRLSLRRTEGVVDDIVRRALEAMGPTLDAAGVAVEADLAAPRCVSLDPDAVEQILANLLGNAAKYGAGGGRVVVTSRQDGDRVTVTVADGGAGVPVAHRERIFEPFHRVSDRVSDGAAGTGIGLDIARRLARLHGGELRLVSSERGACFELTVETAEKGAPQS